MAARPHRSWSCSPSCGALALVGAFSLLWVGYLLGLSLAAVPVVDIVAAPLRQLRQLRQSAASSAGRLHSADADEGAQPVLLAAPAAGGDHLALVWETVALTGFPPLVSRTDVLKHPEFVPDFDARGMSADLLAPAPMAFFFAAGFDSAIIPPAAGGKERAALVLEPHSPLGFARATEDAVRDVIVAILASPGRPWSAAAIAAMAKQGAHLPPPADPSAELLMCRAGPATAPFWCLASLRSARPRWWANEGESRRKPLPTVLVVDAGHTLAGYVGLLAASSATGQAGARVLVIEPQPQCAAWAQGAALASGFLHSRLAVINGLVVGPAWRAAGGPTTVLVPARTGCVLSTTQDAYMAPPSPPLAGGKLVAVPALSVDEAVRATLAPGEEAVVLLLKVDAAGRELDVLDGAATLLDSGRVLNVIVEINKQRIAIARRSASALKAEQAWATETRASAVKYKGSGSIDFAGAAVPTGAASEKRGLTISAAEDAEISGLIVELVRTQLLSRGYEILTADRGWWSAQAPFAPGGEPASDGATLEDWASKVNRRSELDLWAYLPATAASRGLPD